ncbi:hypothetical protein GKE82_23405 [Conexibacter sp. W3-3-2]|uniref:hypothetical protein n=1 Tax=Conexibacter sp. W3-3-2 TaxID=2675227 RepID=UPI0012B73BA5|nr:hypothetical protein [Conexibacter sp. W3-3-2]MTD47152.1 hypothetical protein [Conexibacter sp. W3-3-2]
MNTTSTATARLDLERDRLVDDLRATHHDSIADEVLQLTAPGPTAAAALHALHARIAHQLSAHHKHRLGRLARSCAHTPEAPEPREIAPLEFFAGSDAQRRALHTQRDAYEALARRLAGRGRRLIVACGVDPEMDQLLRDGLLTDPPRAVLLRGAAHGCHANAAFLVQAGRAHTLATGWALSDDGLWRQHSWALDRDGLIIETTEPRQQYFGVELTGPALQQFVERETDLRDAPDFPDVPTHETYLVRSSTGTRLWWATSPTDAREQHEHAEPAADVLDVRGPEDRATRTVALSDETLNDALAFLATRHETSLRALADALSPSAR